MILSTTYATFNITLKKCEQPKDFSSKQSKSESDRPIQSNIFLSTFQHIANWTKKVWYNQTCNCFWRQLKTQFLDSVIFCNILSYSWVKNENRWNKFDLEATKQPVYNSIYNFEKKNFRLCWYCYKRILNLLFNVSFCFCLKCLKLINK